MTITGNYTAGSTSTTSIGLGNPLTVDSSASLAGTLENLAPPTTYTLKSTETLIQSSSLIGTFAKQSYGAGVCYMVSKLNYGPKNLAATVTRSNVAQISSSFVGVTEVALATAQEIQSSLQRTDHWTASQQAAYSGFLDNVAQFSTARTTTQATDRLTGGIYGTTRSWKCNRRWIPTRSWPTASMLRVTACTPAHGLKRPTAQVPLANMERRQRTIDSAG